MRWGELTIPETALAAMDSWSRTKCVRINAECLLDAMGLDSHSPHVLARLPDPPLVREAWHYINAYYRVREVRATFRHLRNYGPCPLCGQALDHPRPATLVCYNCEGAIKLLGYYANQLTQLAKGGGETK